jgi:sugar phosphate isomerase/epimerase
VTNLAARRFDRFGVTNPTTLSSSAQGDHAWLGVGATKPEARRRGAHRALLSRRIEAAQRAGARWVVTETGVPQSGQDAPSQRNILAAGFQLAYVRPNWAPPG